MDLKAKYDLYKDLIKSRQDAYGFIETETCDSLLFSALIGCVPGVQVDIDVAMDEPGRWFRRPAAYPECFECGGSKSTISRDMLLGLAWYAYYNKRLDISEGVVKYALKHWMVMGKGAISRILIMPPLLATFAWISYKLGGPSRAWLRWIPCDAGSEVDDYQAHLQALHIILRKRLTGEWSMKDRKTIGRLSEDQPMNPLFQLASVGDKREVENLLSCEAWWPKDRLPTSKDRSCHWLPERKYGKDWEPSPDAERVHSGGDFLFLSWLLATADD